MLGEVCFLFDTKRENCTDDVCIHQFVPAGCAKDSVIQVQYLASLVFVALYVLSLVFLIDAVFIQFLTVQLDVIFDRDYASLFVGYL